MANICVPITAGNVADAKKAARRATRLGADLIEHRMDFIKDLSMKDVKELFTGKLYPVIATNRRKEEGGHFEGNDIDRTNILLHALNVRGSRPEYVDIELNTPNSIHEYVVCAAKFAGSKAIVSTHFMKYTPDLDLLMSIYARSIQAKADIIKIVTFANSIEDNKIIYKLIEETKGATPLIAFAMGEIGRETRIKSVQMGTFLTFASLEAGKESAPGQIPIQEMKTALKNGN